MFLKKDSYIYRPLGEFLKVHEIGKAISKENCRFHDCGRWYIIDGEEKLCTLGDLICVATLCHNGCGFLNDIAPSNSRLFIDLDVSKHKEDHVVSIPMLIGDEIAFDVLILLDKFWVTDHFNGGHPKNVESRTIQL